MKYYFLKIADDNPSTFKKLNIDHYMEIPRVIFCNEKCSILEDFCYAKFLAYDTREIKSSKTS